MEYLYDGSFDGLLTCIHHHYYREAADGIYQLQYYHPTLMVNSMAVMTDLLLAKRVYRAIEKKISPEALENIYHVYLSSSSDKENLILNYLRLGFKIGSQVDLHLTHPHVYPIHKLDRKVSLEVHRLLGLLRFKDTGRFLYAVMSPDHHILVLIADHFADRLAGERWIIHDQKRKLAIVYDGQYDNNQKSALQHKWYLTDFAGQVDDSITREEEHWQQLWQLYFEQISIQSRYNPRLQSQFVPRRYRRHLVEFQSW